MELLLDYLGTFCSVRPIAENSRYRRLYVPVTILPLLGVKSFQGQG